MLVPVCSVPVEKREKRRGAVLVAASLAEEKSGEGAGEENRRSGQLEPRNRQPRFSSIEGSPGRKED